MNYTQYVTAISTLTAISSTNADFVAILPSAITYAEDRITRELDLIAANVRDSSASTTANSRNFNLPTTVGTFLVVDGINVITPASTAPESGARVPLTPVSRDFLDLVWPSLTGATVPQYFAYLSQDTYSAGDAAQNQVIFGPWPDATYRVEVVGKIQPAALSSSNPDTWIADNLPDLLVAASMVFMSGYMRNFGSQADDAKMAVSWETQFNTLKSSAETYAARTRFAGASWSSKQPEPAAVPQRG